MYVPEIHELGRWFPECILSGVSFDVCLLVAFDVIVNTFGGGGW